MGYNVLKIYHMYLGKFVKLPLYQRLIIYLQHIHAKKIIKNTLPLDSLVN